MLSMALAGNFSLDSLPLLQVEVQIMELRRTRNLVSVSSFIYIFFFNQAR